VLAAPEHGASPRHQFGHQSIVTTERYGQERFDRLRQAAKTLDAGKTFKIPLSQESTVTQEVAGLADDSDTKTFTIR